MTEERLVLANVPRVHFYEGGEDSPEDITFPSCVAAALRYVGEDTPRTTFVDRGKTWHRNDFCLELTAASGIAFGLRWREGWYQDSADLMFCADPDEIIRRAFAFAGYTYRIVQKTGAADDEQRFLSEIRQALAVGQPVLAFGVVGPPECCLVTGYDDSGEVLIGWNFFQNMPPFSAGVEFEPNGYFRKRDWFRGTWSLIIIGEKVGRVPQADLDRETLRWALTVARSARLYDHDTGFAAYDAWARQVVNDADFATDDERVFQSRHDLHNCIVGNLAECRWGASEVLGMMAKRWPAASDDLLTAATCYRGEHDLMWKIWGLVGGNGHPEAFRKFVDPAVRRQIAPLIREAQALDVQAAEHLERALSR